MEKDGRFRWLRQKGCVARRDDHRMGDTTVATFSALTCQQGEIPSGKRKSRVAQRCARLQFEAAAAVLVAAAAAVAFGDGVQSLCGGSDVAQLRNHLVALL